MFECLLYSIRSERGPTPLEAWAAQEAKSDTMAAELLLQSMAAKPNHKNRKRRKKFLVAAALALALATYLLV